MTDLIKRFERNAVGKDCAVGDIHGHFSKLQAALDAAGFDPAVDRLFSVGDLVDRGPECRDVLDWLDKSWFHAVRGNHDDYVCRFDTCDVDNWVYNGGIWFLGMQFDEQQLFADRFRDLPIAIEVETANGLVGVVHADCAYPSWFDFQFALTGVTDGKQLKNIKNTAMWSRCRITDEDCSGVKDVLAVVCGHTPNNEPVVLGNVYHIDTGGWHPSGRFTLLELGSISSGSDT